MKETECTIVMYHYVRSSSPGMNSLSVKDFISQIDYILDNYKVMSLEDYVEFLKGRKEIPKNSCILTFDDGFKDHYLNVFPILKKKKILACFFPITRPLVEFIPPTTHQVHFLLAKLGSKTLCQEFNRILRKDFLELVQEFLVDGQVLRQKKTPWDQKDIWAGNLKYNISLMPVKARDEIITKIFDNHFKDRKAFCQELYMSFDQMKEMQEQGMSFGNHTHSHPKLDKLSREEQIKEIVGSKEILEKELGKEIKYFSYPYGVYNNQVIDILIEQGYETALTTDFDVNKGKNINALTLKRLDTNHLPVAQGMEPVTKL